MINAKLLNQLGLRQLLELEKKKKIGDEQEIRQDYPCYVCFSRKTNGKVGRFISLFKYLVNLNCR